MLLTKFGHSCVVLDAGAGRVVVDPGAWSESEALDRASAVLITHEHTDHLDVDRLVAAVGGDPGILVYAPGPVVTMLEAIEDQVVEVRPGLRISVCGLSVDVVGGLHAEVYDGLPGCANVGYVVEGRLYHPGDAFHVPDADVETLLVPASAPWLKIAESIDFLRAVAPRRAFPIHDALLSVQGIGIADRWLSSQSAVEYERLTTGDKRRV